MLTLWTAVIWTRTVRIEISEVDITPRYEAVSLPRHLGLDDYFSIL